MITRSDIIATERVLELLREDTDDCLLVEAINRVYYKLWYYAKYEMLLRRDDEASP